MTRSYYFNYRELFGNFILAGLLTFFTILFLPPLESKAQVLERVSVADRSDGQGYVVRFHLTTPADSFSVWQSQDGLVQMAIFKDGINDLGISSPRNRAPLESVRYHKINGGLGVDLQLQDDIFVIANAYRDGGSDHLLLGLTNAPDYEVEVLTEGMMPIEWDYFNVSEVDDEQYSELADPATADTLHETDEDYDLDNLSMELVEEFSAFTYESYRLETIVIDPGHGGRDPGAIGPSGTMEKDLTLAVALKLGEYINEHMPDIRVVYTRKDDSFVSLEERGQIANRERGDLFISIHINSAANRNARGTEVYFLGLARTEDALRVMKRENAVIRFEEEDERSEELTDEQLLIYELTNSGYLASSEMLSVLLDHQFANRAQRVSRGVKQAQFIVLYHASMPAILVELGFISNPAEERYMRSEYGQTIMASAIFRAIRDYRYKVTQTQSSN